MDADALELETRRRLFRHIERFPGKYLRELQRDLGMGMGELEYHLRRLETAGLVTALHDANKRFFPSAMDRHDKQVLSHLRQELPRRVLAILARDASCTKAALLRELDVPPSTLNHHLARLKDAGLIDGQRHGRDGVYRTTDPERVLRVLVAHRSSFLDRIVDGFLDGVDAMRARPTGGDGATPEDDAP